MDDKQYIHRLEMALLLALILLVIGGMSFAVGDLSSKPELISTIGVIQALYGFGAHIVIRK